MRVLPQKPPPNSGQLLGRRRTLRVGIAAFAFLACRAPYARSADSAGNVEDIKGEAFADADGRRRALDRASPLYVGDRVATGQAARLTMHLGEDTTVQLGEQVQLVIDQFLLTTGGVISLVSGPMLFDRPSGSPRIPIKIRSPYAVIAVRGTRFFAGPSNGVFGVFVEEGTVAVSAGGGNVTLRAGQGTNIASPGSRPTAPVIWGKARISAALASVQ
jgi:hypothetical protein